MWKSLGLTAIVLFLLGLGLNRLASSLMPAAPTWLTWILSIVVALGLIASPPLSCRAHALAGREPLSGHYRQGGGTRDRSSGLPGRLLPLPASIHVGLRTHAAERSA
jgi:hypothetical protein